MRSYVTCTSHPDGAGTGGLVGLCVVAVVKAALDRVSQRRRHADARQRGGLGLAHGDRGLVVLAPGAVIVVVVGLAARAGRTSLEMGLDDGGAGFADDAPGGDRQGGGPGGEAELGAEVDDGEVDAAEAAAAEGLGDLIF